MKKWFNFKDQAGVALPVVLGIIVTALIAGGAVYLLMRDSNTEQITPANQQEQSETENISGWETYTNTEFGFEFNHPNDWQIRSSNEGELELVSSEYLESEKLAATCDPDNFDATICYGTLDGKIVFYNEATPQDQIDGQGQSQVFNGTTWQQFNVSGIIGFYSYETNLNGKVYRFQYAEGIQNQSIILDVLESFKLIN